MEELQVYAENSDAVLDHDYDLTTGGAVSTLKYSNSTEWAEPGKLALTMVDDGNGLSFRFPDKKSINLDYSEAREMLIMLSMNSDTRIEIRQSQIIKTI
jgi:hypothetical protein